MKCSKLKVALFACVLTVFSAVSSFALPVAGNKITITDGNFGTTNGGEFKIDLLTNGTGVDYISFCLEIDEYINPGSTYGVASVVDYANGGGKDYADSGGMDYLEDATKWVFWNYLQGSFGEKDNDLANNVQKTIWQLEGEITDFSGSTFYQMVLDQKDYSITGGVVKVLNIVGLNGDGSLNYSDLKQSQIIGEPVPEPATMLLFGTGLVGLSGLARRRKK